MAIKKPRNVKIGHVTYAIHFDTGVLDHYAVQMQRDLAGASNTSDAVIVVRPTLPPDIQAETLLHEILHQCLGVAGCDPNQAVAEGCKDIEEKTVWSMAGVLLDVLRDNPDVLKFLLNYKSTPQE